VATDAPTVLTASIKRPISKALTGLHTLGQVSSNPAA
jgi:hypothetical protein